MTENGIVTREECCSPSQRGAIIGVWNVREQADFDCLKKWWNERMETEMNMTHSKGVKECPFVVYHCGDENLLLSKEYVGWIKQLPKKIVVCKNTRLKNYFFF